MLLQNFERITSVAINRRETADPQFYIPTPYERQASPDSEGNVPPELK